MSNVYGAALTLQFDKDNSKTMARQTHPAPWPTRSSITYDLARFLVGAAPEFHGCVPLSLFFEAHPFVSRNTIAKAMERLRRKYGYYAKASERPGHVDCALEWPECYWQTAYKKDGQTTYRAEGLPISDPRLHAPSFQRKFRVPKPGTMLRSIYDYILRHREPETHLVNCDYLYRQYGTLTVHGKLRVLRGDRYGMRIQKAAAKGVWFVERQRNSLVTDPTAPS